ncbi:MAG: dTMP kinase [Caulobacteraceae bacterium]
MRGKLICISGLDGCGKTTQSKLIYNYITKELNLDCAFLNPFKSDKTDMVVSDKKYTRTIINFIKRYNIEDDQFHCAEVLCYAQEMINTLIIPKLQEGKIVIVDRYIESSFLYFYLLGISSSRFDEIRKQLLYPDLWVFIDVPPEECYRRIQQRGQQLYKTYESIEALKKQREYSLNMQHEYRYHIIDGNRLENDVFKLIKELVHKYVLSGI